MLCLDVSGESSYTHGMTPTTTRETIAGNVRALLGRHRTSQTAIAKHLGTTQQSLSRRLVGDVAFDTDELSALAAYFDVPITDLFDGIEDSVNPKGAENPVLSVSV